MKITRKQLNKLIETFIVGPAGKAVDMNSLNLDDYLDAAFEPYVQKIINHPLLNKLVLKYLVLILKKKMIMKSLKHQSIYSKNQSLKNVN